jgi:hypothetical protein
MIGDVVPINIATGIALGVIAVVIYRFIQIIRITRALKERDSFYRKEGMFQKEAKIKVTLAFGKPAYENEATAPYEFENEAVTPRELGEEFYSVPLLGRLRGHPREIAEHEIRHRIQWNHPKLRLLTIDDIKAEHPKYKDVLRKLRELDRVDRLTRKEIDAIIFEVTQENRELLIVPELRLCIL